MLFSLLVSVNATELRIQTVLIKLTLPVRRISSASYCCCGSIWKLSWHFWLGRTLKLPLATTETVWTAHTKPLLKCDRNSFFLFFFKLKQNNIGRAWQLQGWGAWTLLWKPAQSWQDPSVNVLDLWSCTIMNEILGVQQFVVLCGKSCHGNVQS